MSENTAVVGVYHMSGALVPPWQGGCLGRLLRG
jgi:hypothetical protein